MQVGDVLDPTALLGKRWFAAPDRPIASVVVEERFGLGDRGALAILRLELGGRAVTRRTIPIEHGGEPWAALLRLATGGGSMVGEAGSRLLGSPAHAAATAPPPGTSQMPGSRTGPGSVRPLGKDQSHSSVVIDDRLVLKLYRKLTPGINPEIELGAALSGDHGAPVPTFRGAVRFELPAGGSFAIAIVQDFVADAGDAFESVADRLAAWLRAGAPPRAVPSLLVDAAPAGRATARLHAALARVNGRAFTPRAAGAEDGDRWRRGADRAFATAVRLLPSVEPGLAAWLGSRRAAVEAALEPLATPGTRTLQRIHADLHLGQLLRAGEEVLLGDLEGEPTRSAADRRRLDTPLRDLASMLRSFDHVARSAIRRSGVPVEEIAAGTSAAEQAIDTWLAAVRSAFREAYEAESAARDRAITIDRPLLHALEVEKELYEFSYAATYLPAWRYAPAAGMRWLLDHPVDP